MKKSLILIAAVIILSAFVLAENKIKVDIGESFSAGERIAFQISLYDEANNLVDAEVSVVLEDAKKTTELERTVSSNKPVDADLGENAIQGLWKLTASYQDAEDIVFFTVEAKEEASFELEGDKLIITNLGNTRYSKDVDIRIGNSLGTKKIDLEIGEKTSFRLVAPDGVYNVGVSDDGMSKSLKIADVSLTGKVIGILDEELASGGTPVTGGIKPGEGSEEGFYSTIKRRSLVYLFLVIIIGAGILLAIERRFRKKI